MASKKRILAIASLCKIWEPKLYVKADWTSKYLLLSLLSLAVQGFAKYSNDLNV